MAQKYTDRHPVVAQIQDGPRKQHFRAAKVVNCHAQQVLHRNYNVACSTNNAEMRAMERDVGGGQEAGNLFGVAKSNSQERLSHEQNGH